MSNYTIRDIKKEDNPLLAAIIRNTFIEFGAPTCGTVYEDPTTDNLYSLFQRHGATCWVALVNDEVKGCAGVYPTDGLPPGCCEFVKFYLAPEARGTGLGKQLMNICTAWAKNSGYTEMYLESLPAFSKAVGLYEQSGFHHLATPMGNSGHPGCNIWMIKKLDDV